MAFSPHISAFHYSVALLCNAKKLKSGTKTHIFRFNQKSLNHFCVFQDIYSWAGKKRLVEISKDGKQFFPTTHFDNAYRYIDNLIDEFKKTPKNNKNQIAERLAIILDTVNYLHPFREGNGRTQREFLRLLALEKAWVLNLNLADNLSVYKRYMKGTIESDVTTLTELIFELLVTKQ
ncbi:MAG: filamentation induced by camp protein fic [Flavobacterium sp. BFFFF2]|nr:MAG: filamentation induced by camp protein fic [Flavobacterium sp. BFFFF2]